MMCIKSIKQRLLMVFFVIAATICHAFAENTFQRVTKISDLENGDRFIIVANNYNVAMSNNLSKTFFSAVAVTISDNRIVVSDENVLVLTLEKDADKSYLRTSDGRYLANNSGDKTNSCCLQSAKDEAAQVSIAVIKPASGSEYATVDFSKPVSKSLLNYNGTSFSCYPSSNKNLINRRIILYKLVGNRTATEVKFDESNVTVFRGQEESFVAPTARVIAEGSALDNAVVRYSSSNTDVASIDETTGNIVLGNVGNAKITATYDGDDVYENSSASYDLVYKKHNAALAFYDADGNCANNTTLYVMSGEESDFVSPKAVLSPEGLGDIVYKSSDSDIASVEADGTVSFGSKYGSAVITASFAGNDYYSSVSVSYTLCRKPNSITYSANDYGSFDKLATTEYGKKTDVVLVDDTGNEHTFNVIGCCKTRKTKGVLKLFSGRGVIKSDYIDAPNGYKVKIYYFQNSFSSHVYIYDDAGNKTCEKLIHSGVDKSETDGTGYITSLSIANSGTFRIETVEESRLSKIVIEKNPVNTIKLVDSEDCSSLISDNMGKTVNAVVCRKFYKDPEWLTLCLPFSVDAQMLKNVFGDDVKLRGFDHVEGSVINFSPATEIKAGRPYILKITKDIPNDRVVFTNVKIENDSPESCSDKGYSMTGIFTPTNIREDGSDLFLGDNNLFYYPLNGENLIYGFRSYFSIPKEARNSNLYYNPNEDATDVNGVCASEEKDCMDVFSIDGRRVNADLSRLPKGIYIVNGKKLVVSQ